MTQTLRLALILAVILLAAGYIAWELRRAETAPAPEHPLLRSFPKRSPLPPPSLAELADDMQVISPAALADIFRRENAHLPH